MRRAASRISSLSLLAALGVFLTAGATSPPEVARGARPSVVDPVSVDNERVDLTYANMDTDGECCTAPGQISGCWDQDANRDQKPLDGDNDCRSHCGDDFADNTCYVPQNICFSKVCDKGTGECRPSWCNGYDVCSCWGGCEWGGVGFACGGSLPACRAPFQCVNEQCLKPCLLPSECLSGQCVNSYCTFAPGDACYLQELTCAEGNYPIDSKASGYCYGGGTNPSKQCDTAADCYGNTSGKTPEYAQYANNDCVEVQCINNLCTKGPYVSGVFASGNCAPGVPWSDRPDLCCCSNSGQCPKTPCVNAAQCALSPTEVDTDSDNIWLQCKFTFDTAGTSCKNEPSSNAAATNGLGVNNPCTEWECDNAARPQCEPLFAPVGGSLDLDSDTVPDCGGEAPYKDYPCNTFVCGDIDAGVPNGNCGVDYGQDDKTLCAGTLANRCSAKYCNQGTCATRPNGGQGSSCDPFPLAPADYCHAYSCSANLTCVAGAELYTPSPNPALEACAGGSLGIISADADGVIPFTGDNACADDDFTPAGETMNSRFAACFAPLPPVPPDTQIRKRETADYAHYFTESVGNAFQLRHSRITLKPDATIAGARSPYDEWSPLIYTQRTCTTGAGAATQVSCNAACDLVGTKLADTLDCSTLGDRAALVTTGPWPVFDSPAYPGGLWDTTNPGLGSTVGFSIARDSTTTLVVDARQSTPPFPPGGPYSGTVTYEGHNNNDCRATAAVVQAPVIKGPTTWKERWRGRIESGFKNFVCTSAGPNPNFEDANNDCYIDPANTVPLTSGCWHGAKPWQLADPTPYQEDPKQAFFRVELPQGLYKAYTDELGVMWSATGGNGGLSLDPTQDWTIAGQGPNAGVPFLSTVLAVWGTGSSAESACLSALNPSALQCHGGPRGYPKEHIFNVGAAGWKGWLEVSNNYKWDLAMPFGPYELNVVKVPQRFFGMLAMYHGENTGSGCGCDEVTGYWPMKGYRLDFVPTNTAVNGMLVVTRPVPGSLDDGWLVSPDRNELGGLSGRGGVVSREIVCEGDVGANGCVRMLGPYELPFAFPYSGELFKYYCIDASGRIDLRRSGAPGTCTSIFDRDIDSRKATLQYDAGGPTGYAPDIFPLWGHIVPCYRSNSHPEDIGGLDVQVWSSCKGDGKGRIVRQIAPFEGTTALVISWEGFDSHYYPYSASTFDNSARFQVLLRPDGRFNFFYKRTTSPTVWDDILAWSGWIVGFHGTRSQECGSVSGGTADAFCRTSIGSPSAAPITCDNDDILFYDYTIYHAANYCQQNVTGIIETGISGP